MTPMQKLKNNLDLFKELIGDKFTEIQLNKAAEKSTTVGDSWSGDNITYEKKGVKNDFLKIYRVKLNKEDNYSFAFNFTYIDLAEKDHAVEYTFKLGTDNPLIISSEKMNIEEFKTKLNEVNTNLKIAIENNNNQPIDFTEVIELVGKHFIEDYDSKLNYTTKINSGKKRVRKMI